MSQDSLSKHTFSFSTKKKKIHPNRRNFLSRKHNQEEQKREPEDDDVLFERKVIIERIKNSRRINTTICYSPQTLEFDESVVRSTNKHMIRKGVSSIPMCSFRNEPVRTKLDELVAFNLFGFDLKITPEEKIQVVEVNGLHTGLVGFRRLSLTSTSPLYSSDSVGVAVSQHLKSYGKEQLAYLGGVLLLAGIRPSRMPGADVLATMHGIILPSGRRASALAKPFHERYYSVAEHLVRANRILKDKYALDALFSNNRSFKSAAYLHTRKGLERFLDSYSEQELCVLKPRKGARGTGVRVLKTEDLEKITLQGSSYVLEPFIPSIPIFSDKTNSFHDGCMRYVALVEEDRQENILVNHFGAYWRLCPESLKERNGLLSYFGERSAKANLTKKAIPQRLSPEHLDITAKTVDELAVFLHQQIRQSPEQNDILPYGWWE